MAEWTTPAAIYDKCGEDAPTWVATHTIDDDTGTGWRHVVSCYHWIIFDMGATKKITRIKAYSHAGSIYRWGQTVGIYVYVSNDPNDFGDPVWEGLLTAGAWTQSGVFDKNGRYIKLLSKSNSANQRLQEFDAYAEVIPGEDHFKTVTELLGLVDSYTRTATFHKTTTELLGLVDSYDKNKCKKCKPSVICVF